MEKTKNRTCFITIEGGEGAGKSTLINKIKEFLFSKGIDCILTREPGGTPVGEKIRDIVLHKGSSSLKMSALTEFSLFLASRAEHVEEVIKPALKANKVVICDRFNDSSWVYQGYVRGLDINKVELFCDFAAQGIKPNLTLFLDIDPSLGFKRIEKKELDRIEKEKIDFHQKVREGYHLLAKKEPNRFFILDATKKPDEIFQEAKELIICCLKI